MMMTKNLLISKFLFLIIFLLTTILGAEWNVQTVNTNAGWSTSIAVDSNGEPHISYMDLKNYTLKYTKWNGSKWEIQTG
ncbi:MAG: hypothetical protein AB1349_13765 [Elusimicrobiota bacterium]